ncbi:hypothetical protein ARMSODRAFT_955419 [Armillaria solidipes]|uniref:Uncharacterized protein n=1 Tax=Armillaria solidipes TaxID=1076256 RepID=A0A2H3BP31_9AGAR|nr:hypothetical protein ARMSODRAFT_955419 [Armillaria solidipes]
MHKPISPASTCLALSNYDPDFLPATDSRNGIPPDNKTRFLPRLSNESPPSYILWRQLLEIPSEGYVVTLSPSTPTRNEIEIFRAYHSESDARHGTRRRFRVFLQPRLSLDSGVAGKTYAIQIVALKLCLLDLDLGVLSLQLKVHFSQVDVSWDQCVQGRDASLELSPT